MPSMNIRISSELEEKMKKLQTEVARNLPRGAEVTMSSLVRGAIEKLIEEFEEEKNFIITTKTPLLEASKEELECLKELKVHERLRVLGKQVESKDLKYDPKLSDDFRKIEYRLNDLEEDSSID